MTSKKKITLIIVGVIVIALALGIYYVARGGFTAKQRYNNCAETCTDLMILESSVPACLAECEEITGYSPTAQEEQEALNKRNENTNTKTNTSSSSTNTNTANANTSLITNTNTSSATAFDLEDYENREYYCNWVWYQEIIDKDTSELIYECTSSYPWCNYADGTFENVGCCKDAEHTDCITLPNLL